MIDRRTFLGVAAASAAQGQSVRRPNILHIMSDEQQWGTIAGRSECRTPNLNRLANSGMLFERSYTPSALCCPARAMMLSGAYHWHNGVYSQTHSAPSVHRDMNRDVVLYSMRLREAGYRQGYVGKWHASYMRTPLEFGFDEVADLHGCWPKLLEKLDLNPDQVEAPRPLKATIARYMQWPGSQRFPMWGHREGPEESTPEFHRAECAIRMLRRFARGNQPWHLEVHYPDPGDTALLPLKKYLDRYDPRSIPVARSFHDDFRDKPNLHRRESESWNGITEDDYRQSRAHYYAYWEQLDAQIGRILDALEETGQAGNTIVTFTTDHGDMNGAHRMWLMGWMPYEECYRVPMVMRWPGVIPAGAKTSHLVQTHDLAHTYTQAAGTASLPYADGRALQPLFADPARKEWNDEILCAFYGGEYLYTQRIAITSRHKYVFNGFDYDELYDLQEDPTEMRNLARDAKHRNEAADMQARLYAMMARLEDPMGDVGPRNSVGRPPSRWCAPRYLPRGKSERDA